MANPALGTKRECPKCSAKFYDLKKNPAACPICAHSFDPEAPVKKRGKRKSVKVKAEAAAEKVMAAKQAQQAAMDVDEDDIDLPDIGDDIGLMEDMDDDDLDDMDGIKGKPSTNDDENEDDEAFIEDEDLLEEKSLIEELDDEDEDEDDDK
ncbi:MAG: TIGR02300 family protein [Rickettsiales bacterium]